jgi:hypothetical protein
MVQTGPDRSARDPEDLGDLELAAALEVVEHE